MTIFFRSGIDNRSGILYNAAGMKNMKNVNTFGKKGCYALR